MAKALRRILTIIIVLYLILVSFSVGYAANFQNYHVTETQEVPEPIEVPVNPERVTLNADRVSFNDETGNALAEGGAVLTYNDTTIMAERIEYNADTQKVHAMPLPGEQILLKHGSRTLKGDQIEYDLNTKEGILTGALTKVGVGDNGGVLYVYGSEIDVMPWELAQERGLVKGTAEDYIIQWRNVVLTTCALEHPHYRLESKTISFIPGKKVIAKRPRVYLGNTYLFTSPMDYVVQLKRKSVNYSFLPYFQKSSSKGAGGGITGTIGWDTGSISLGTTWFNKSGWEFMFEIEQELNKNFRILAGVEYSWDDAWDERVWRPHATLFYQAKEYGWEARLRWTHNEYIEDQKDSNSEFKGRLDRRPEFIVYAPWFKSSLYSWMRIYAAYGSFKEKIYGGGEGDVTARYGIGLRSYFEKALDDRGNIELFSDTTGEAWFYDRENADHEVIHSFTGLRYKLGSVEMGTAYESQKVWGESAMHWDQYKKRKRIHQKIRVPLGKEVATVFRGSYDLDESMIDEMNYSLRWETDCMIWDLHYKDDRTSGGDDKIGLTISLNAFPNSKASFGQKLDVDPFLRPADVPGKNYLQKE